MDDWDNEKKHFLAKMDVAQIQQYIDRGEDVNVQDNKGWTLLLFAVRNNNSEAVGILLEAKADVKLPNENGATPLHIAADCNKEHFANEEKFAVYQKNIETIIDDLLKKGADANADDKSGKTPIDYADDNVNIRRTYAYDKLYKAIGRVPSP